VAQWIVHVDQDFAIFDAVGSGQVDAARKILGNIGARVDVVREIEEFNGVGFVVARETQAE